MLTAEEIYFDCSSITALPHLTDQENKLMNKVEEGKEERGMIRRDNNSREQKASV
jgi:hypothetical protein